MASNLLVTLENKSWGIKSNPKQLPKSCGLRQSEDIMEKLTPRSQAGNATCNRFENVKLQQGQQQNL